MRISDWSSDVCSSDLISSAGQHVAVCDNGTLISMKRGAHGKPAHLVHTAYTPPGAKALAVVTAESFVDPSPPPLEAPTITRRWFADLLLTFGAGFLLVSVFIDRKSTRLNSSH